MDQQQESTNEYAQFRKWLISKEQEYVKDQTLKKMQQAIDKKVEESKKFDEKVEI